MKGRFALWAKERKWIGSHWTAIAAFFLIAVISLIVALPIAFTADLETCNRTPFLGLITFQIFLAFAMLIVCLILLWNVTDAFYIKFEFKVLVFVGTPLGLLLFLATYFGWRGVPNSNFWINVMVLIFLISSIWVPLVGTFTFAQRLKRGKLRRQGSKVNSVHSANLEDEFQMVAHDTVLWNSFKKLFPSLLFSSLLFSSLLFSSFLFFSLLFSSPSLLLLFSFSSPSLLFPLPFLPSFRLLLFPLSHSFV